MHHVARWLWGMRKAGLLQSFDDALRDRHISNVAASDVVAAFDDLVAGNLDESDCLGVSRLESNRSPCWDIETVAMRADAIKIQLGVSFDEVVVGADLSFLFDSSSILGPQEASAFGEL